MLFRGPVA